MGGVEGIGEMKRRGAILQAGGKGGNIALVAQGSLAAAQVGDQAVDGLVTVLRFFRQHLQDDGRDHSGHAGADRSRGARLRGDVVVRPLALILAAQLKRQAAGEQLVEHHPETVEIAAAVHRAVGAGGVLRRHVGGRAADDGQSRLL